jgi:endogenous inhibitor of DNA gyrase (YacG/DUF329 family)
MICKKTYTVTDTHVEFGKSRTEIECPFCKTLVWTYNWSLAGSGKRCPTCGAKHGWFGTSVKEISDEHREEIT